MATVFLSSYKLTSFLEGGGHFWVYMQYAQGLRRLGCDVYWLESTCGDGDPSRLTAFFRRMEAYGLGGKTLVALRRGEGHPEDPPEEFVGLARPEAEGVFQRADLLLNFNYRIDPALLARFQRTALVDIDPGLLQFWISRRQLAVPEHDIHFTTGETVGTPAARFPDCGRVWCPIRPPVCLELWPYVYDPRCEAFTTVSSWQSSDWLQDGDQLRENTKRVSFLQFAELPRHTPQVLELALFLVDKDAPARRLLESQGWRLRHSCEVAATPEMYQAYVQGSRGEFSCAKPSCMAFQNAWISDRTLCYLASGKPAVVQHTGPSSFLPNGEGLFRFSTLAEAVEALAAVNAAYQRHCRAARELAETYFDAKKVCERILQMALGRPATCVDRTAPGQTTGALRREGAEVKEVSP
jgi:hypothetical protein